jgi:hypothetical protein
VSVTGGQSVEVKVDPSKLRGVMEIVKAADRLAARVEHGDEAMMDSTVVEAAQSYRAIRSEWAADPKRRKT